MIASAISCSVGTTGASAVGFIDIIVGDSDNSTCPIISQDLSQIAQAQTSAGRRPFRPAWPACDLTDRPVGEVDGALQPVANRSGPKTGQTSQSATDGNPRQRFRTAW